MMKLIVLQWLMFGSVVVCSFICIGGVSLLFYDLFNLGVYCGDNLQDVEENWWWMFVVGGLLFYLVWLEQVYGIEVLMLDGGFYLLKCVDVFYSCMSGIVCVVMIVDCLLVLFCNCDGIEVVVVYVGWCGLCEGVLEVMVVCFVDKVENIMVWLGFVIGLQVFEVGLEVWDVFMVKDKNVYWVFCLVGEKYFVDIY